MRPKVVILINELLRGGAQRIVVDIARFIDKEKVDLQVAFLKAEDVFPPETKSLIKDLLITGVKVTSLGGKQKFSLEEFKKLRSFLKRERPDIIHTFLPYAGTLGRVAARLAGVKNIISTQCNLKVAHSPKIYWLDKITLPLATAWTAATEGIEKEYGGSIGYFNEDDWQKGRRHFTIAAGVDVEEIQKTINGVNKQQKRATLGIPVDCQLVTMTARLISWKGHVDMVAAMTYLPSSTHVAFIGWGPLHDELQQQAEMLKVADRVHFLGSRADVYEILGVSDIYVQAHCMAPDGQIWMGPNTAQMEAAAAGVPMVSTAVPLVERLVEDDVTGKLTPPSDPQKLAQAINWLLNNQQSARELANNAQQRVKENYSLPAMVKQYQNLYLVLNK